MNRSLTSFLLILNFCIAPIVSFAQTSNVSFQDLVLPSEVEGMSKSTGNVYYSPVVRDRALIPVHIWGAVQRPGLHFVPTGTSLIEAISIAGGPATNARLRNVRLTRGDSDQLVNRFFNLTEGGGHEAYLYELQARDNIFIERSLLVENRNFYTSLVGVAATILSSVLVVREIKRN